MIARVLYATVSIVPPIIPYGGFSPVRLEGWRFGRRLPNASLSSSLLPAYADHVLVCFRPSCIPSYPRMSRSVSGRLRADAPPWRVGNPPPQGSSLESGLCCPGLSSLNRPHPPHSQAHHDFAARRLIRNAFAVRERLGDLVRPRRNSIAGGLRRHLDDLARRPRHQSESGRWRAPGVRLPHLRCER
jgi:hypothetical protein